MPANDPLGAALLQARCSRNRYPALPILLVSLGRFPKLLICCAPRIVAKCTVEFFHTALRRHLDSFSNPSPQRLFFKNFFFMTNVFQKRGHYVPESRIEDGLAANPVNIQILSCVAVRRPLLLHPPLVSWPLQSCKVRPLV